MILLPQSSDSSWMPVLLPKTRMVPFKYLPSIPIKNISRLMTLNLIFDDYELVLSMDISLKRAQIEKLKMN